MLNNDNQREMAINLRVGTCRLEEGQLGGAAGKKIESVVALFQLLKILESLDRPFKRKEKEKNPHYQN